MGGGNNDLVGQNSLVSAAIDPVGFVASKTTGQDIKLNPISVGYDQGVTKPKEMKEDIEKQIKQQEEEARKAEEEYKNEQSDAKKKARDLALQNLQRSQARLQSLQPTQKGGYSGTVLTSPLGINSDSSNTPGQKTLLGY